ncbi:hypothetical protein ACG02S_24580 [Roseateles sp. DC23W]|uniref:Uncharacterized protein n=1 Tax=Pelomonas dachongensis TaxID=3299029 RepID=A0ABW7EY52_9BURK
MDLRLPPDATPNAAWLSRFVDRHGPTPAPDLGAAAEALFVAYARARSEERAFLSEAWETRFLWWLLQSGDAHTPARLAALARTAADAAFGARVLDVLNRHAARR